MIKIENLPKLYQQLAREENLVFSPTSMMLTLILVCLGADGQTRKELLSAMSLPTSYTNDQLINFFVKTINYLNNIPGAEINTANMVFAQEGFEFNPLFLNHIEKAGNNIAQIDFKDVETTLETINSWVQEVTNDKIVNLLESGSIDKNTKMVLISAIHFLSKFVYAFDPEKTTPRDFTLSNGNVTLVDMMNRTATFPYFYREDIFQLVALPYDDTNLSLVILLPKKDGLSLNYIMNVMTGEDLSDYLKLLKPTKKVQVFLPKFEFTWGTESLNPLLESLGIYEAFTQNANFELMDVMNTLYLDGMYQQAYIKTNEEGTEAAAASAAVISSKSLNVPNATVYADHPFAFFIVDLELEVVLFAGRVENPNKQS